MKGKLIAVVLALIGLLMAFGSAVVMMQDHGSCPAQLVGSPYTCDHAYIMNGSYIWMRPLYNELAIASIVLIGLAAAIAVWLRINRNPRHCYPGATRGRAVAVIRLWLYQSAL